ncbi:Protein of unknown function DUF819 [Dillenia turbinata]|uniref:Uncharacterized protein n=1 Tax=Dillenia turbinata TaxID=194707 RepID=A0AAN8VVF0_9MAGN
MHLTHLARFAYEAYIGFLDVVMDMDSSSGSKLPVLQMASALVVSFAICKTATYITKLLGIQRGSLPGITATVVLLATLFPKPFGYLAPVGDSLAVILMQVIIHLAVILGFGKLFCFDVKLLLLASNANIGGPTTACGMATANGWKSLVIPGIHAGIFWHSHCNLSRHCFWTDDSEKNVLSTMTMYS